ncbi:polyprenyl synthetase family protein [Phaeacidiphilus oryzae]|uniref:polyprenyl synthetase family protein n=1 Tax=Phaeacidiphilus oryzae TaxID=348818 RepID=UPI0007C6FD7D|nr:polyprenyl synthetase family protein [Phaeacidiphilus oryzae]
MSGQSSPPARNGPAVGISSELRGIDEDVTAAVRRRLAPMLDEWLATAADADPRFARDIAHRVARFTLVGGSRMRAHLLWWAARSGGATPGPEQARALLTVACAVELLQSCALVHDDVMDGSALRRGAPALHSALGRQYPVTRPDPPGAPPFRQSAAILAGDLALAWADDAFAEAALEHPVRAGVRSAWRQMRCEMVAGQYLDLRAQALARQDAEQALRIAYLKTARYSVEHPLALGALLTDVDPDTLGLLRSAGRCAGIAFQLRDDLLGAFGDPARTGKPVGDDIRAGKATYLAALAFARTRPHGAAAARAVLQRHLGDPDLTPSDLHRVQEVLESTGARSAVQAKIADLSEECRLHLSRAALDPVAGPRLTALLDRAVGRGAETRAGLPAGARIGEAGAIPARRPALTVQGARP